jgi:hypothetical protein
VTQSPASCSYLLSQLPTIDMILKPLKTSSCDTIPYKLLLPSGQLPTIDMILKPLKTSSCDTTPNKLLLPSGQLPTIDMILKPLKKFIL